MKQPEAINHLCLSCRRSCKQDASVLIAACPRYYQGPNIKRVDWKQLSLLPMAPENAAHEPAKKSRSKQR
ncbi:hypothetical protein GMLC_29290 [Geomonas limicola]|uniref:Uncharacterized protein n=1 Tax=Geomonas limicola TaxID=2740186 RepID=A0A6V8NA77_9BACT|nr:hypothetical protein [Geomonas limicola]GFO69350.1 hypothetical protein GMLC_29290 [Geomonas limicola]